MIVVTAGHGKHALGATGSHTQYKCAFVSSDYESGFRSPGLDDDVDDLMCLAVWSSAKQNESYCRRNCCGCTTDAFADMLAMATSADAPLMSLYCNYASNPYMAAPDARYTLSNSTLGDLVSKLNFGDCGV